MADCTPLRTARRWHRLWALAVVIALCALGAGFASLARADGDPASDVLAEQTAFIPAGRSIPAADQARLQAVIRSASRQGFPVRVALIAAPADLGAVTALWRQPAEYAHFLGTELADVFHGTLIVVMPNGYGVWIVGPGVSRAARERAGSSLIGAPLAGTGQATAAAAVIAVRRVAAAAGHPLPAPTASAAAPGVPSNPFGALAWIALAAGGLLIAAAWLASLRARPWRAG